MVEATVDNDLGLADMVGSFRLYSPVYRGWMNPHPATTEGIRMKNRLFAGLSAFMLMLAAVLAVATPAQADEEDCPESHSPGYICLWKWIDWEGGRWQAKINDIAALPAQGSRPAGCWNLSGSGFGSPHSGQPVNNESASLVIEPSIYPFTVQLYDWVDCQIPSLLLSRDAHNTYTADGYLGGPNSWCACYHKITSIKVFMRT